MRLPRLPGYGGNGSITMISPSARPFNVTINLRRSHFSMYESMIHAAKSMQSCSATSTARKTGKAELLAGFTLINTRRTALVISISAQTGTWFI